MAKVKLGLRNLSVTETIMKGNLILHRMQGNAYLPPDPVPSLMEIQNSLIELKAAALAATTGDKTSLSLRNKYKKEFIILLRRLGGWISSQTTERGVITSTGFDAVQRNGRAPEMKTPMVIPIFDYKTCSFKILWKPIRGAKQYIVESSANPYMDNAQWIIEGYTSKAKYTAKAIAVNPPVFNFYRVKALGSRGISIPSNIVKNVIF